MLICCGPFFLLFNLYGWLVSGQHTEASTSIQEEKVWVEGLVPGIDFCNHGMLLVHLLISYGSLPVLSFDGFTCFLSVLLSESKLRLINRFNEW